MLSFKGIKGALPLIMCAVAISGTLIIGGCSVRPLYGSSAREASLGDSISNRSRLASVEVAPVSTRAGQQVRNHLIFLLNGGAKRLPETRYLMSMTGGGGNVSYTLKDTETNKVIGRGMRSFTAGYNAKDQQQYANIRMKINAEDRAAREVAEFLLLDISVDIEKASKGDS